jgi:hypothetical protein
MENMGKGVRSGRGGYGLIFMGGDVHNRVSPQSTSPPYTHIRFHRTLLRRTKLEGNLALVFRRYGGSARHCFKLASTDASTDLHEESLRGLLLDLPDLNKILSALKGGVSSNLQHNKALEDTPSQILTVVPGNVRQPLLALVTRHVTKHFYRALNDKSAAEFWSYFNMFSSQPQSRASAGWLWERHVLRLLSSQVSVTLPSTSLISEPPLKKPRTTSRNITVPFDLIVMYGGVESLAKELSQYICSGRTVLFVPGASNEATFDAFLIANDRVYLFQPTISPDHDVKVKGLDFIWDSVNAAMKLLNNKSSEWTALSQLLPNRGPKWHLMFVVPVRVSDSWKYAQNINFGGKKPKRAWDGYLAQSVIVLEDKDPGTHIFIFNLFSSDICLCRTPRTLPAAR